MKYQTTTDAAKRTGTSPSYVKMQARAGRIPGAYRTGYYYIIPDDWQPQLGPGGRGRHVSQDERPKPFALAVDRPGDFTVGEEIFVGSRTVEVVAIGADTVTVREVG